MRSVCLAGLIAVGVCSIGAQGLMAGPGQPVSIQERARGAAQVVVATVTETSAAYERNEFGDELIVTHAKLAVEEALKGTAEPVTLAIEGGTVGTRTLRVSDLPSLAKGERAVFFLTPGEEGESRPHLRGQGILKLDANNRVRGSSLTLDEIRQLTRQDGK